MISALCTGLLLGLSCGLAPGPLLTLLLAHTLRHGAREGCKIALTPLITDVPMLLTAGLLASRIATIQPLLGFASLLGGCFILWIAWESLRPAVAPSHAATAIIPNSLAKGVVTNLLNPYPWLFWLTVGVTTLAAAASHSWFAAAAFLAGFYLLLVGSKLVLAFLVARSRRILSGRGYRVTLQVLAAAMVFFALLLFHEGTRRLGLWGPPPAM